MSVVVHTRVGGWCWVCGGTGVPEIRHVDYGKVANPRSLAARLNDAKLAGHRAVAGAYEYHFRSNEMAANMALNLFAEWLREHGMGEQAKKIVEGEL